MKKSIVMLSMVFFGGNSHAVDFTDTAQVISSSPIYERISEPRRECTRKPCRSHPKSAPWAAR